MCRWWEGRGQGGARCRVPEQGAAELHYSRFKIRMCSCFTPGSSPDICGRQLIWYLCLKPSPGRNCCWVPVLFDGHLSSYSAMREILWLYFQNSVIMPMRSLVYEMSGYGNVQNLVTKITMSFSLGSDRNSFNLNKKCLPVLNWNRRASNLKVVSICQNQMFVFHLKKRLPAKASNSVKE